ncbi:hypothetical protein FNV43_RR07965 [Rhamnella rubrinervis]|uniref:Potassium channel domain-containing protein n=1 Tax=Rhamnella rubrinervis TaxID=2594499 RepID=A0A8K0HGQ6_9ROSA|nr:hypothetical protein FNV43_RR07965 [Rhamnella rubrinervis]
MVHAVFKNAVMDTDAKRALLSETVDNFQFNEKKFLQRRRSGIPQYSTSTSTNNTSSSALINNSLLQNEAEPLLHCDPNKFSPQQFSIRQVMFLLVAYLGGGTLCFFLVKNQIQGKKTNGILDAMYFSVVTMTTVGYGDLVPDSILAKLLACVYVFTGVALAGILLGKAADYLVEKQEILLVRAIYMSEKVGQDELVREAETHKVKYKFITAGVFLLMLIVVGTFFLYLVEDLDFLNAFYCVCSTITTLGYGDESFSSGVGRIFAVFWILGSTICLAQFYLYLAELYTEGRQRSLMKWVLTRKLTYSDLEEADLDHDKVVSSSEFVLYKLKEMGKISQGDISAVIEAFKQLDIDQSGTLTASDLQLSQSS